MIRSADAPGEAPPTPTSSLEAFIQRLTQLAGSLTNRPHEQFCRMYLNSYSQTRNWR